MKLAIVIPWFGRELKGGAEQHAWQVAARLARRGHAVEVLTTCCRSHQDDWSTSHLPPGAQAEPEGFTVRRFPVERRNHAAFDQVAGFLMNLPPDALSRGVSPVPVDESEIFVHELIKSRAMLSFLQEHKTDYDWFILLPYLYGPVLQGVEIVGDRAALQPCLHDEAYAYLPQVRAAFQRAEKLLFISEGERELAARLFGPSIWPKSILTGAGVEIDRVEPFHSTNGSAPPRDERPSYVLYLGRKDPGKNVPMLLRAFSRFRAVRPKSDLRLLLAGNGEIEPDQLPIGAEDLGLVDDQVKDRLLQDCAALFQPSQNESFSRVMMEAWMKSKPVAAHARCLATAVAVQNAQGGWLASTEEEWAGLFCEVARLPAIELAQRGERGRAYATDLADWDAVMDRYEQALPARDTNIGEHRKSPRSRNREINQFLPNLAYGDAISNHAIWIRAVLRKLGFRSEIYVRHIDPRLTGTCRLFSEEAMNASEAAIYHHSVGTEITRHILNYTGPRCLIYHNITPPEFYRCYNPGFAKILEHGRADLCMLADHFPLSYGVSRFNAEELRSAGFAEPQVMPLPIDPAKWRLAPDEELMQQLQDDRTNLLYVARIAPNKKQDDLLHAFELYLNFDPDARLILVGKAEEGDPYAAYLRELVTKFGLEDHVLMPGNVADEHLAAYYRCAHLFWSMSEHEGFCVPLIEAMWFDIPILAFRSSAIPETLGEAGLMFNDKNDLLGIAAAARLLSEDRSLRSTVIAAHRKRRLAFLPVEIEPSLIRLADELGARRSTVVAFS